ncbi:hypothetical protein Fmac_028996 [Flemingia macrophylla]|uniref:Uncharacterized protein n=1 Tax=Flemingia macrophylla TaxID=520843 RepID=A0ABD1L942_9FABA
MTRTNREMVQIFFPFSPFACSVFEVSFSCFFQGFPCLVIKRLCFHFPNLLSLRLVKFRKAGVGSYGKTVAEKQRLEAMSHRMHIDVA